MTINIAAILFMDVRVGVPEATHLTNWAGVIVSSARLFMLKSQNQISKVGVCLHGLVIWCYCYQTFFLVVLHCAHDICHADFHLL